MKSMLQLHAAPASLLHLAVVFHSRCDLRCTEPFSHQTKSNM